MTKLQTLRRAAGLSQSDLSFKSGVKLVTLQKLESGQNNIQNARVSVVLPLAKALGTTVENLVSQEGE